MITEGNKTSYQARISSLAINQLAMFSNFITLHGGFHVNTACIK